VAYDTQNGGEDGAAIRRSYFRKRRGRSHAALDSTPRRKRKKKTQKGGQKISDLLVLRISQGEKKPPKKSTAKRTKRNSPRDKLRVREKTKKF